MSTRRTNWAGNVTFRARQVHRPASRAQLQALVAREPRVRALGAGHSFSGLADSPGVLVSLAGLPPVVEVDSPAETARVAAGMSYTQLARRLDGLGFALRNLGSLANISVAGACATATHGSGASNGNLATEVVELELVTADGDVVTIGRGGKDNDEFSGAVVGLGALGVVVGLTLSLVPSYWMRQYVYEGLPLEVLGDHFTGLMSSGYSVSLFTDWRGPRLTQVWIKQRAGQPPPQVDAAPWFTAVPADGPRHPIAGLPPGNCTEQMGVPGPWFGRLPHFRPEFIPGAGHELQSEYLVSRQHAAAALEALSHVRDRIHPVLGVCEIRTVAADGLWLSPSYRIDTAAIHFTWVADADAVRPAVALVENQLAPFGPRPHWGKIFTTPPETVCSRYPRLADFQELARRYDPARKFGNSFTDRYLLGT